ncbi:hypothetical protein JTE90_006161 [Oedothorax gibbosus]|uniref:BACK domain-containing protein n=1 Tax=Oedothorax gibbosus TaxID=931172 RepID=A0AAV6U606_9ARAC|nr:hypothetical protein JTE90_006161 [Oedothorax gibbosus]
MDIYRKTLVKLLAERFEDLIQESDFFEFDLHQIKELLSEDQIGTRSEVVVFLAALKWLNHDIHNRPIHSSDVMKCVRFLAMTLPEVLACLDPPIMNLIRFEPQVKEQLAKALLYISAKSVDMETYFSQFRPRPRQLLLKKNLSFSGASVSMTSKLTPTTQVPNDQLNDVKVGFNSVMSKRMSSTQVPSDQLIAIHSVSTHCGLPRYVQLSFHF